MHPTLMKTLLAQGIATDLAVYEVVRNDNTRNNRNGGGTSIINQNNSTACSYKEFMVCKP